MGLTWAFCTIFSSIFSLIKEDGVLVGLKEKTLNWASPKFPPNQILLFNNFASYFLSFLSSLFHLQPIGNRTLRSFHPVSAVCGSLTALSLSLGLLGFFLYLHGRRPFLPIPLTWKSASCFAFLDLL